MGGCLGKPDKSAQFGLNEDGMDTFDGLYPIIKASHAGGERYLDVKPIETHPRVD